MLFTRRESSWPLYFFGVIALLIVLAVGWITLVAVRGSQRVVTQLVEHSPQELIASYRTTLDGLQKQNAAREPKAAAEESYRVLISARVPKEMLEEHLKAIVALTSIKNATNPTVDAVSAVVTALTQKAASL